MAVAGGHEQVGRPPDLLAQTNKHGSGHLGNALVAVALAHHAGVGAKPIVAVGYRAMRELPGASAGEGSCRATKTRAPRLHQSAFRSGARAARADAHAAAAPFTEPSRLSNVELERLGIHRQGTRLIS